ncbi:dna-directed rna polymerase ii subunit rpb1 [Rhizoctonia solani]|uniref:Dna-directed rna polymerase ii subunit rpb1 n=1 Tax=Rhizoctonia solani TaxID=456999 RepID=A0A8H7IKN9_9AGAM|nr:dna-directed rna polymerase ii subunit rpb1 [Rhizoctonia solani]
MLDGQTHLVKQGWKGVGHPLKAGGRSRPVVVAQKKTLGGIGKDRDESFAFWDHLYDVAAKTIKLKLPGDESSADSDQENQNSAIVSISTLWFLLKSHPNTQQVQRTHTGILSNRRPTSLPTPSSSKSPSPSPGSILSLAKKEAARRALYSRFLRGPVITQENLEPSPVDPPQTTSTTPTAASASTSSTVLHCTGTIPTTNVQIPSDDKKLKKAEKAARRLAKEERRKAKAARREAREERRKAKAIRDEARAAKEKRKIERAAKRAAKVARKQEKEQHRAQAQKNGVTSEVLVQAENGTDKEKVKPKREKKRKRDGE